MRNQMPSAPVKTVRRSFSWGKKKKEVPVPREVKTGIIDLSIDRYQAETELGLEMHMVTGDIIVSYVGHIIESTNEGVRPMNISVGDCVLAIQGVELIAGGEEALAAARNILKELPGDERVELTIERHSMRNVILKRHAALRGTSLDKLGLTLVGEDGGETGELAVVAALEGLAAKSQRIVVGDRLIAINGRRFANVQGAVELLAHADLDDLEVELELVYGFMVPKDHEFDTATGTYVPRKKESGLSIVKRSLSFGKKKRNASGDGTSCESATPRVSTPAPMPEIDTEPRMLSINKNAEGMIQVSFLPHPVTGELIVSLVGNGSPAQQAGVEVGDRVLAMQGAIFDVGGDEDVEYARAVLANSSHCPTIEIVVQTCVRTEVIEFGQSFVGGPKNLLGLSFYSYPDDWCVRITNMTGSALKSGRLALGDRIISVNGIRVNHAQTLSDHIAQAGLTSDYIEFEVALGYAADEGVWYGKEPEAETGAPRKVKRSFSFGRKPRH